jgi:hypothetical protein
VGTAAAEVRAFQIQVRISPSGPTDDNVIAFFFSSGLQAESKSRSSDYH